MKSKAILRKMIAMLVASLDDVRIDAVVAQRGPEYRCPKCKGLVILKKGRKVIDHFAHKRQPIVHGRRAKHRRIWKQNFLSQPHLPDAD